MTIMQLLFPHIIVLKSLACAPHLSVRTGWQRSKETWSWQTEDSVANSPCWCNSLFLSACVCAHSYHTHRTHAVTLSVFQRKGVSLSHGSAACFRTGCYINRERNGASSLTRVSGVFTFDTLTVTSVSQAKVSPERQGWILSLLTNQNEEEALSVRTRGSRLRRYATNGFCHNGLNRWQSPKSFGSCENKHGGLWWNFWRLKFEFCIIFICHADTVQKSFRSCDNKYDGLWWNLWPLKFEFGVTFICHKYFYFPSSNQLKKNFKNVFNQQITVCWPPSYHVHSLNMSVATGEHLCHGLCLCPEELHRGA